jgi:hypothetical protein
MDRPLKTMLQTLLALSVFAAALMVGCSSSESKPAPHHRPPSYEPPPANRHESQFEPRDRADGIPSSARLMEQGKGVVSFTAGRDGRVFVEDTHDLKLLLETQLFEGETLTVDPKADTLSIDGKPLPGPKRSRKLVDEHRHRIYFVGDRTVRQPHSSTGGDRDISGPKDRDVKY